MESFFIKELIVFSNPYLGCSANTISSEIRFFEDEIQRNNVDEEDYQEFCRGQLALCKAALNIKLGVKEETVREKDICDVIEEESK